MYEWKAQNAIFLDNQTEQGRPFKARFLQAGLVKYDFGVCMLKKETIDKFVDTFVNTPVIIGHKDYIDEVDKVGIVQDIWFSETDGWFWCSGILTSPEAIELVNNGYSVSCQYRITEYKNNTSGKLHNGNPYDKEILNGVFEHLAIVQNPRYEEAIIAVNAIIVENEQENAFLLGLKNILENYNNPSKEDLRVMNELAEIFEGENGLGEFQAQNSNWNPDDHPRHPRGSSKGGQFAKVAGVDEETASKYTQTLADYCKGKGYIIEIEKSSQSLSRYIKLYQNKEQQESRNPFKEIRISDHQNKFGDKDVMLDYNTDIEESKKSIDKELENYISDDFIKGFKGFIYDSLNINPELNYRGLSTAEIQRRIKDYYKKYLQTSNNTQFTKHIFKEGIGNLYFSKLLEDAFSNKRDLQIAKFVLPNIEKIIELGNVLNISNEKKEISTDVLFLNEKSIFNVKLPVRIDTKGNWVVDVIKTKISSDDLGAYPGSFTANNTIITHLKQISSEV